MFVAANKKKANHKQQFENMNLATALNDYWIRSNLGVYARPLWWSSRIKQLSQTTEIKHDIQS